MAIAYVQSAIGANNSQPTATDLDVTLSSTPTENNTMVMVVHLGDDVGDIQLPTGGATWILGAKSVYTFGGDRTDAWYYKIAGASEPTTYSVQHDEGTDEQMSAIVIEYSGVDVTTPIDEIPTSSHEVDAQDNTLPTPAPIDTNTNGAFVLVTHGMQGNDISEVIAPVNYRLRESRPSTGNNSNGIAVADIEVPIFGTETPGVWQHVSSPTNIDEGACFTFALRPAAGAAAVITKALRHGLQHGLRFGVT